jgi:hypothetical protein
MPSRETSASKKKAVLQRLPRRKSARAPRRTKFSARTADRYELYQLSVQSPENDIEFLANVFKKLRKRTAYRFREDFCGTALLSATWVQQGTKYTAEGFDLDPEPISWGMVHNLEPIGKAASRVTLHLKDVRAPGHRSPDIRVAQNFSYSVFKKRAEMLEYFRAARASLVRDGMFVIDLYGGYEATEEMEESRKIEEGFTYVWDQARYLPGTADYLCHIHFRFRDGTRIKKAFTYDWRYWTLAELRDVMYDAGFARVLAYFEQSDRDDGEGNGEFELDEKGESCEDCAGWVAYLVALK